MLAYKREPHTNVETACNGIFLLLILVNKFKHSHLFVFQISSLDKWDLFEVNLYLDIAHRSRCEACDKNISLEKASTMQQVHKTPSEPIRMTENMTVTRPRLKKKQSMKSRI